jgi:hypothetical protein
VRHAGAVYGASKNKAPGSKHYYRPALSGGKWDEFLETRRFGTVLQVCTGGSRFGTARVDADITVPGVNVAGKMDALPFADDSFDTVACDPMYEIQYPDRVRLQRELFRVARYRLLFKSPWIPRGTGWSLKETVLVASHTCANVAVLSVLDRDAASAPLFAESAP